MRLFYLEIHSYYLDFGAKAGRLMGGVSQHALRQCVCEVKLMLILF